MKKNITYLFLTAFCSLLLVACNMTTPENYFDRAVLNCNMMMGFANNGLEREFEQPSVKLVEGTKDQTVSMKRKEIIDARVQYLDESFAKIKDLKETEDSKNILQSSIALYSYVLPVYKNEYVQLAKLYDDNASKEQIASFSKTIRDKYAAGFLERFDALTDAGKLYAAAHNIKVNWGIKTSPDIQ